MRFENIIYTQKTH